MDEMEKFFISFKQIIKDEVMLIVKDEVTAILEQRRLETMTYEDVCKCLGISKPTLHKWCKEGFIKYTKAGRRVLFDRANVDEFLNNGMIKKWERKEDIK